jgi:hypothetical protein
MGEKDVGSMQGSMRRGPSDSSASPEGVGRLFLTARNGRLALYRGGIASKKNGRPAPRIIL